MVLVLSVRDVKVSLGVTKLLGETEVDDVNLITTLSNAHEEIVRFDIAMNKISRVDIFDTRNLWHTWDEKRRWKNRGDRKYQLIGKQ